MSRAKDARRALMMARDPSLILQQLATSSRGEFAVGGAPYGFVPFMPPSFPMAQGTTIQPGAIAPPRPPAGPAMPWPTTPPVTGTGGRGNERRGGNDRAAKATLMAQKIGTQGMGPAPGSAPLNSATGGGNGGFAAPSTFPAGPDNGGVGNTSADNYGGAYAGAPGIMGVAQALADNQSPAPGQIAGALAGLATGPAGLGIGALGMGLNALGFAPSQDPHGTGSGGSGSDKGAEKGGDDAGSGGMGSSAGDMSGEKGGDDGSGGGGGMGGGDDGGGGDAGGGGSGAGDSSGEKAAGGEVDHGARTYEQGFRDGHEHFARGGLLQDRFPTHYMPGVGRQVMADGGMAPDGGAVDPRLLEFDPSRIFDMADGGVVARALALATGGKVDTAPSDAQKEAGNYRKDHVSFQGLPISIENKKGSVRSGVGANGKPWHCTQPADYGYIKRTEGADGDHVDVYIGPHKESRQVFVVNQQDSASAKFDEHKVMLGYHSEREAIKDYCAAFSDGKGPDRIRSVEPMSLDAFKEWLKRGATKKPIATKDIVSRALALCASKKGPRHV